MTIMRNMKPRLVKVSLMIFIFIFGTMSCKPLDINEDQNNKMVTYTLKSKKDLMISKILFDSKIKKVITTLP